MADVFFLPPRHAVRLFVLVAITLLAGCAGLEKPSATHTGSSAVAGQHAPGWSRTTFRLSWAEDAPPDFSLHLLIADRLIAPIIAECSEELIFWRFHRRAARDEAGHLFSFLYYTDERSARKIQARIDSKPLLRSLLESDTVLTISHSDSRSSRQSDLAATSDSGWPAEVQKSWPYFIQGVSASWLDLIRQHRENLEREESGVQASMELGQTLNLYQKLNTAVVDDWGRFGRHAYLHHLNALYGYTPVYIFESESWQRF